MKHECGLIRDLLPIYYDGIASKESVTAVEEHLSECPACKKIFFDMSEADKIEQVSCDKEQSERIAESYKQVKRKRRRKMIGIIGLSVGGFVLVSVIARIVFLAILAGAVLIDGMLAKPDVHTSINDYKIYRLGPGEDFGTGYGRLMNETIWPEEITDEMDVVEFKLVHYDPFDPQYLGYMVVQYAPEAYEKEMMRLKFKGCNEYLGYYGITGFDDYEIAAIFTDKDMGHGLVYALTDGEGKIVYVLMEYCNYFFDLHYEEYIPEEYLPRGFNAHEFNPYRSQWLKKNA